jgi:hypothetical protein
MNNCYNGENRNKLFPKNKYFLKIKISYSPLL